MIIMADFVVKPRQARSEKSLANILDAAEALMRQDDFENIPISQITARAGLSVGNFYARFSSKEALLELLHERYEKDRSELISDLVRTIDGRGDGLKARIEAIGSAIWDLFESRQFVLRSLIFRVWRNPADSSERQKDNLETLTSQLINCLLVAEEEINHTAPEEAVTFALHTMLSIFREAIVTRPAELPGGFSRDKTAITGQTASMMLLFLTQPSGDTGARQ